MWLPKILHSCCFSAKINFEKFKIVGDICKHLAGAYNSNSHARELHYLTFVCGKQAEKSTQWGESF
jgi:hypothetical protein